ncbi:alkylglycerol monooxygenase-like isoform X2 [Dreissena polymorpha]|uniref:alkylglycerol monooxygenase-like isoform X2 n=1 Tax=Dreissena polymorpha TaxID=45954 RepID=UPI002264FA3B|nr:alkylglycerol monooxygenase-like isoform X2 [Dreissena polymorpha]
MDILKSPAVSGLRRMFILVSPNESSFENVEDVPDYVDQAVPYFASLIILEWLVLYGTGKTTPRLNDSLGSLSNGLLSLLHGLLFRSTELAAYVWFYQRFNFVTLPWDSPWTWLLCLLGVDLAYYWVHRFGHEVNLVWSGHQTHHSSEDYNLSTALRQSALQKYFSWVFYLPLALFLPPSIFLVHTQFNLVYQFWVHTETISRLGPLEWVLSTPSHHRVHHGRNPYCIDKNYGGVFIIWDRLFGTFEAERRDEKVVYGLIHNIDTWEPIYAQLHHLVHIIKSVWSMKGVSNKLSVLWKGPGWAPGKPRLGINAEIPEVKSKTKKYDVNISWGRTVYIWVHYLIILLVWHQALSHNKLKMATLVMSTNIGFIIFSLFVFGSMYDRRKYADLAEVFRCLAIVLSWSILPPTLPAAMFWFYLASVSIWSLVILYGLVNRGSSVAHKKTS